MTGKHGKERGGPPTVCLLTDFGLRDPYVGAMKGAMLSVAPELRLVDVSHEIAPHDVLEGSFTLACAAPWFPQGTIHLAVVDPGVGGPRRALVARCGGQIFVAPDNGLLTGILDRLGETEIWEVDAGRLGLEGAHPTFHGRDLFGPLAARLALGSEVSSSGRGLVPEQSGPPLAGGVQRAYRRAVRRRRGEIETVILHVDRFGNLTVDLRPEQLGGVLPGKVRVGAHWVPLDGRLTYAGAPEGALIALWGSAGYLEIAKNQASAARALGRHAGESLRFRTGRTADLELA